VQVVVEHAVGSRVLVLGGAQRAGLFGGVGAQQVMGGEPARHVLGEQAGADEFAQP